MAGVPRLSHLQYLVVGILRGRTLPGREIRRGLEGLDVRKSGPAFYQLMSRLEDRGLVKGEYNQEIVAGQIIRERHYELTAAGSRSFDECREFYLRTIQGFQGVEGLARG